MAMKTPGVYIVEKNAFPNSVVEVATAVPAFIGYTERAVNGGTSLAKKPWRIGSMAEYERYFGGAPHPVFSIKAVGKGTQANLPDMAAARGQEVTFNVGGQDYLLSRAAGKAGGRFLMYQAMRHFFQNGGGACYIVSVGDYNADISAGDESKDLVGGITPLLKEQEPTMVLVPDAVLLSKADCAIVQAAVLKHCGLDTRNRFAILDVWGGEYDRQYEKGSCIDEFRDDIGINFLDFAAAYYPWLNTSLVQASEIDYTLIGSGADLANLLTAELQLGDAEPTDKKANAVKAMLSDLQNDDAAWKTKLAGVIDRSTKSDAEKAAAKKQLENPALLSAAIAPHRSLLQKSLMAISTLYPKLLDEARGLINLMPPAAAMAGLYTMVDNTRGVWKAPANVSVAGVVKPAVDISQADQEDLNVTTAGKSINAIRSFIGEGALVWGARTLDGNSLDWRYVNVRRTMIMLEESCRLAAKAMVFEPNVSTTWVTIKSMIGNFLTGIWKRGGLMGAVPDEAFSVQCGLGETMTPEDVLEGILRVTVLVAMVRPAEFIEITFKQQMPKS
ncbi:MAG: phage tail sheath family protein [Leptothrix sp. (in: b-proteobacteria)]